MEEGKERGKVGGGNRMGWDEMEGVRWVKR